LSDLEIYIVAGTLIILGLVNVYWAIETNDKLEFLNGQIDDLNPSVTPLPVKQPTFTKRRVRKNKVIHFSEADRAKQEQEKPQK